MADTHLSTTLKLKNFLISSTKLWSLISAVATTGALATFHTTQQSTNKLYIPLTIITLHFILFFSNPRTHKPTVARFFPGSAMKWALRITAMRFVFLLYIVPEQTVTGLMFVICVWVDVVAITRIVSPKIDLWVGNMVFMVVVSRSGELYGLFSGRYWLVFLMCYPLVYMQIQLKGYESDGGRKKGD